MRGTIARRTKLPGERTQSRRVLAPLDCNAADESTRQSSNTAGPHGGGRSKSLASISGDDRKRKFGRITSGSRPIAAVICQHSRRQFSAINRRAVHLGWGRIGSQFVLPDASQRIFARHQTIQSRGQQRKAFGDGTVAIGRFAFHSHTAEARQPVRDIEPGYPFFVTRVIFRNKVVGII